MILRPDHHQHCVRGILAAARDARAKIGCNSLGAAYSASMGVLKEFIGLDWLEAHIMGETAPTDFFRNDWSDPSRADVHMARTIQLAEMLINLQGFSGIKGVIGKLATDNPESAFAELETGKLLAWSNVNFSFREASYVAMADYDLDIYLDGHSACADTKCKLETTGLSVNTIIEALRHAARRQLPPDKPGLVFIKTPQEWELMDSTDAVQTACQHLFRGTKRIVCVYQFTNLIHAVDTHQIGLIATRAIVNPQHRFDNSVPWDKLLTGFVTPEWWIDIARIADENRGELLQTGTGLTYVCRTD